MQTIDVVTYNGEGDLFELRYNILKDFVDEFIVIEFDRTFSGRPKESTFTHFYPKVTYHFVTENIYSKYIELARSSPNTAGAEHWKTEFAMKESIKDCLTHLKDDDICFIGDVDEIWEPEVIGIQGKLRLRVYTYYLNNRSSEDFYGTITYPYKHIKDSCLNHLRTNSMRDDHYSGWHFTSLKDGLRRKLEDSYTSDSYATPEVMGNLESNIENNRDFLGRNFTYRIDESELPQYLLNNRTKYAHLFA